MALPDLHDRVRSGVLHINFMRGGQRVGSGSAFVVGDYVVTNNHVFRGPAGADVVIRFADSDPGRLDDGVHLSFNDFERRLVVGSDERAFDYAVLRIPEVFPRAAYRFHFAQRAVVRVGMNVAFFGYPLEHLNLVCHAGIVSSIYMTGPARIYQLDASVNASNSGGPLVDADTGAVLGLITRKATGLTRMFQDLLQSFQQNIQVLEGVRGMIGLGAVDPIAAMIASQNQMQQVAREIERSANVGIGYAFSSEHVAEERIFNDG